MVDFLGGDGIGGVRLGSHEGTLHQGSPQNSVITLAGTSMDSTMVWRLNQEDIINIKINRKKQALVSSL